MEKIRAKSVIHNKFWILQNKHNKKVGQVRENKNNEFEVIIHGRDAGTFTLANLRESDLIEFTDTLWKKTSPSKLVHGFPTSETAHNAIWNVASKLPLYTTASDSRSWYAAGYYKLNISGTWIVQYCPKLITLQRNDYKGPYETNPELNNFDMMFS